MFDEIAQYVERLRSKGHALFVTPQTMIHRVEPKGFEYFHLWTGSLSARDLQNEYDSGLATPASVHSASRISRGPDRLSFPGRGTDKNRIKAPPQRHDYR